MLSLLSDMAGFGDTVDSLLETYSICLSRLKGLKGSKHTRQLRKNIRSDQYKVRSAYSLRLAATGNNLQKGDGVYFPFTESIILVLKRDCSRSPVFIGKGYQASDIGHCTAGSSDERSGTRDRLPVTSVVV